MLTQARLKYLFNYNPDTGVFTRLVAIGGKAQIGVIAGSSDKDGYWRIGIERKMYPSHRLAWLYMTGKWPKKHIDHKNCNPSDNRFENLREATIKTNRQNIKKASIRNVLGVLGVTFYKGKFTSYIKVDGKSKNLGRFNTADEAHQAYVKAKRQFHEGCTI